MEVNKKKCTFYLRTVQNPLNLTGDIVDNRQCVFMIVLPNFIVKSVLSWSCFYKFSTIYNERMCFKVLLFVFISCWNKFEKQKLKLVI